MCSRLTLALRKQKEKENLDDIAQKLKDYMKVTECLPVEEEVEVITPLPELTDQMQVGKIWRLNASFHKLFQQFCVDGDASAIFHRIYESDIDEKLALIFLLKYFLFSLRLSICFSER